MGRGEGMSEKQFQSTAPTFLVDDVTAAAEYYRDVLGFRYERLWGEPPSFCMAKRDGVVIMLKQTEQPGDKRPNQTILEGMWDAYIWVANVEALLAEFQQKGAKIRRGPEDTFYGCREIDVEDCNGYLLCFGQIIE